ncbi:hypothetical protein WR25_00017 [Diploscapter pachys]|uniref:Uncharacterized protein n=1 Tax=Diploscapter pachys TaxID=2018661 RepID=A0A2A2KE19_9BILA|nr:hypothetical protein WR25_00017 [Diploscapter pachys]
MPVDSRRGNGSNGKKKVATDAAREIIALSSGAVEESRSRSRLDATAQSWQEQEPGNASQAELPQNVFQNVPKIPKIPSVDVSVQVQVDDAKPHIEKLQLRVKQLEAEMLALVKEKEELEGRWAEEVSGLNSTNQTILNTLREDLKRAETKSATLAKEREKLEKKWRDEANRLNLKNEETLNALREDLIRAETRTTELMGAMTVLRVEKEELERRWREEVNGVQGKNEEILNTLRENLTKAEKKSTELEVELTVATREKEDIERRWREEAHKNEDTLNALREDLRKSEAKCAELNDEKTALKKEMQELERKWREEVNGINSKNEETLNALREDLKRADLRISELEEERRRLEIANEESTNENFQLVELQSEFGMKIGMLSEQMQELQEEKRILAEEKEEQDKHIKRLQAKLQETEQLKDTLIEQSLDQNRKEMDLGRREMELSQQLESTRKQVLQLQNEKAASQNSKEKIAALEAEKQQTLLELGSLQNERTRHLEEIESLRKYKLDRLQQNAETDKWREENDRLIEQVEAATRQVQEMQSFGDSLRTQLNELEEARLYTEDKAKAAMEEKKQSEERAAQLQQNLLHLEEEFMTFKRDAELQYQTEIAALTAEKQVLFDRVTELEAYPGKFLSFDGKSSSQFWDLIPASIQLQLDSLASSHDPIRTTVEWLKNTQVPVQEKIIEKVIEREKPETKDIATETDALPPPSVSISPRPSSTRPDSSIDYSHIEWRKAVDRVDELILSIHSYKRFKTYDPRVGLPDKLINLLVDLLQHVRNGNEAVAAAASRFWSDVKVQFNDDAKQWKERLNKVAEEERERTDAVQRKLDQSAQTNKQMKQELKAFQTEIALKMDENRALKRELDSMAGRAAHAEQMRLSLDELQRKYDRLKADFEQTLQNNEALKDVVQRLRQGNKNRESLIRFMRHTISKKVGALLHDDVQREFGQMINEFEQKYLLISPSAKDKDLDFTFDGSSHNGTPAAATNSVPTTPNRRVVLSARDNRLT